jgi:hypothetical protein
MFNVHPIFRYFVIEPPSALTRYIRRKSKNGASFFTPLLLGTLTIFLPCGVTQAMMATALGTGSPIQGAILMFSFILGTSPLFFSVAYFATRLGSAIEKYFTRIVAVTMLIMGLVQIDTGLNLSGASFSISRTVSILQAYALPAQTGRSIEVNEFGYFPQILHLPANQELTIEWVTRNTQSCARSVVVPGLEYQEILPVTGRTEFNIPPQEKGAIIRYTCSMGMYPSQFVFDLEPTETN